MFEYGCCMFASSPATQLQRNATEDPATVDAQIGYFAKIMSAFSLALRKFTGSRRPHASLKEDIAISVLQLHVLNTYISFHIEQIHPDYRPHWDKFLPHMNEMVGLGEKIVCYISRGNEAGARQNSFCLDMGFIIPLFTVASVCQDPIIRRKAIAFFEFNGAPRRPLE